ncbi:molybdate ABC transporter substrate-binding protein [Microbacterium sp.]|uniref:molybdate ABC transporter substrate-binding protein n=1 Tax=Microbacterium sp. TaxID=51671 RepID=UPI003A8BDC27
MRRRLLTAVALAAVLPLAGCASTVPASSSTASSTAPAAVAASETLTVFAAASLQAVFDELADAFAQQHPEVEVAPIRYDGSSTLATQLLEGAPADVFASADEPTMQGVVDAGLAPTAELFATNTLVLVVPAGNPGKVTGVDDLADPDRTVVLCAPEVPCGRAATALLDNAGVSASVDSFEQNVTAVLTKVVAGEADAGLVYVTDATTTDDVDTVTTAGADTVVNRYPIVALDGASEPAADAFVAFVLSEEGQAVLRAHGFGAP